MSIRKGTTKIDYSTMTNEEVGEKFSEQLYYCLRVDWNYYNGDFHKESKYNDGQIRILISAYEKRMEQMGLVPKTKEIVKAAEHDNHAHYIRLAFPRTRSLDTIFYSYYKKITYVIDNKYDYIGKEIKIDLMGLKGKFTIAGIGNKSICLEDDQQNKVFCWYTSAPLRYDNNNAYGIEIASLLYDEK